MDAEPDGRKSSRERSPRFPFISLEKALERAAQLYAAERRGAAPFEAVANHWGYRPSTSGALQTLAALRSYGLVEGINKSLRLSELAQRILLDKRPDSQERELLKRQAALNPPIAASIQSSWPDGLPSDATLHHHLVLELGFSEETADKAVKIIKDNQSFAFTSYSSTADVQSSLRENLPKADDMSQSKDNSISPITGGSTVVDAKTRWIERTNDTNGLSITLEIQGEPTEDTFEYLREFVNFKLLQLKNKKAKQDLLN